MNIGFIHPSWPGSEGTGATHTATQIVDSLINRGHDIVVYCAETPPPDADLQLGVDVVALRKNLIPHTNIALNRAVRSRINEFGQHDLVSSYLPSLIPALNDIAEETSASTVVTLNAYGCICPKNDLQYMDSRNCNSNRPSRCLPCLARTSHWSDDHSVPYQIASRLGNYSVIQSITPANLSIDGFHALSGHVKRTYASFDFPDERITVISNPVDNSFITPHKSKFIAPYSLLYVGYLEEQKGVELLPKMMSQLDNSEAEFNLTIVGDGGMRTQLEESAAKLGVQDAVDFLGHVSYNQLPTVYAHHDLFVYPGLWKEPFGRVFLEAMCAGTPVVATDVGAADEITGSAGVVTEPTATALAAEIESLVRQDLLTTLSQNTQTELKRYKPYRIGQQIQELYKSLL